MTAIASLIYFQFLVWPHLTLTSKAIGVPNFDQISQCTAEILVLSVSENKRRPYWNSTSGFDFWPIRCHRHVILHWCTKFYANWIIADGVMASYWFYNMAAIVSQVYFGFWFGHVWLLGMSKVIGIPNFDQISQSTAEILLLPVSGNKPPPYWNSTFGFDLNLYGFPSAHQSSSKSYHPRQSYDVILMFEFT